MPARFYMNMWHRKRLYVDEEGDELESEAAAREHAFATARDLIRLTRISGIRDWFDCTFEITNEQGETVLIMPFGDMVPEVENAED